MNSKNPGTNVIECVHGQEKEELRAPLEGTDARSDRRGGASAREDRTALIPGPSVRLVRCDSISSLASVDTTESTSVSIAGKKRQNAGEDSSSSSPGMTEAGRPKKPRGKKKPQVLEIQDGTGEYHRIRDPTGRFAIDPRENRRNLAKLESLRAAESAALDRSVQLPARRLSKSRALRQKMLDEMAEQPTADLTAIVGEEVERVEKLAYGSNNLNGTTQKALYEAAAKISAAASILEYRVQSVPGVDALEELRAEMEALKKENAELRAGLKTAKADIKKLRERSSVRIVDSPVKTGRTSARRRIDPDSESGDEMEVDGTEGGDAAKRDEGAMFPRPQPPIDMGELTPVLRPPLKGAATRNLDDGSLGMTMQPLQAQSTGRGSPEVPDIKKIVTSVLKELGLVGKGATTLQQRGESSATLNTPSRGKKEKRGKPEGGVGQASRARASLLPRVWATPPPAVAATAAGLKIPAGKARVRRN